MDSLLLHFICQRCKQEVFLKTLTKLILSSKISNKSTLGGKPPPNIVMFICRMWLINSISCKCRCFGFPIRPLILTAKNILLCGYHYHFKMHHLIKEPTHRQGAFLPLSGWTYLLWKRGWLNSSLLLKMSNEKVTHDRTSGRALGLCKIALRCETMWF